MRPHGRAGISSRGPRALAVCDRCGFMLNHDELQWQMRWRGPRLQNVRLLVCSGCLDTPNEQERTFVLPPDPVPIANPRPENYVVADNPASPLGYDPAHTGLGVNFGNLVNGGGIDAAFSGAADKPLMACASLATSNSSFQNIIGKNWAADATGTLATMPSSVSPQTHILAGVSLHAPSDQPFLRTGTTGLRIEGSSDSVSWTAVFAIRSMGYPGEVITATVTSASPYQYHRVAIEGDGFSTVGIAQAVFNIADAGQNEI